MSSYVLDASALLAMLFDEPGGETVLECLPDSRISSVNFSEVAARLSDRDVDMPTVFADLRRTTIDVVAFDREQAEIAAGLRRETRAYGLSLGDRACLALARHTGRTALTADRAWDRIQLSIPIQLIR